MCGRQIVCCIFKDESSCVFLWRWQANDERIPRITSGSKSDRHNERRPSRVPGVRGMTIKRSTIASGKKGSSKEVNGRPRRGNTGRAGKARARKKNMSARNKYTMDAEQNREEGKVVLNNARDDYLSHPHEARGEFCVACETAMKCSPRRPGTEERLISCSQCSQGEQRESS